MKGSPSNWPWLGMAITSVVLALGTLALQKDVYAAWSMETRQVLYTIGQGNGDASMLALSADGQVFAFASEASDLVPGDNNQHSDIFIFIYNRNTPEINRASLTNSGAEANGPSYAPSLSANGRFVAFESEAKNLVLNDTNGYRDIFVRDLVAGVTERISLGPGGAQANGHSFAPSISGDGRYVVFESDATNLVAGDTNLVRDVFLHDRHQGTTRRISISSDGVPADQDSFQPMISANGESVVFASLATNLVPNDNNHVTDIFLHNVQTATTQRLSSGYGGEGNGPSNLAFISATGDYITFRSLASNLVPNDDNRTWDIFVYARKNHTLETVSVATDGTAGNSLFSNPDVAPAPAAISADGRYVLFQSDATNLVAGDTNGRMDIFLRDRQLGVTERMSVGDNGKQAQDHALGPGLSADGRFVAFLSAAPLVADQSTGFRSLFYRNRQAPPTATPTPTKTATPTATPSPTPTMTATPTETATEPLSPARVLLPLVAAAQPWQPPVLHPIQNATTHSYTVHWTASRTGRGITFVLQESTDPDFSNAAIVYSGPGLSWHGSGKAAGQYFYRVRMAGDTVETPWSQTQSASVYPLFVGLHLRWQGSGVLDNHTRSEFGYTWEEQLDGLEGTTIRSTGRQWYEPNPEGWPEETWTSFYNVTTGEFLASSLQADSNQRWGYPWILPYAVTLAGGSAVSMDGQIFTVTGPHRGTTAFGAPVAYWRLANRDHFLFWEDGDARQYVNPGDIELWYDSGESHLLLRQKMTRHLYQGQTDTGQTLPYSLELVEANASFQ